jgi:serine/threonine protein kinase
MTPGTRLGPYEILAPIGAGGMGEVYKARDTRLDRTVAIKVSKEKFSERFEREARSIAALNHPHICQLYDVGPDYLVMEYIDGTPLKGPLTLDQAMKYARQICEALDAAHKKGITHRDLKPANIMVTKAGVKLLDFGLARIAAGAGDETVTMGFRLRVVRDADRQARWTGAFRSRASGHRVHYRALPCKGSR